MGRIDEEVKRRRIAFSSIQNKNKNMNPKEQRNQILFSVCLKAAAEVSEKGIAMEDLMDKAMILHKMFEAYMERLKPEEKK